MDTESNGENSTFWRNIAPGYDDLIDDNYKSMIQRVIEDVGSVDRVLDVATGTGFIALEIAKKAKRVEAIDFVPEMISAARMKAHERAIANVNFSLGSAYKLGFPDHSFDAVIISNSLHVMREPEKALKESRRVLKTGGSLVVPTFCLGEADDPQGKIRKLSEKGFKVYHFFTVETFGQLVEKCGFCDLKWERMRSLGLPMVYLIASA